MNQLSHNYNYHKPLDECTPTIVLIFFDFIQWKPTDTWPRDRCGREKLVLLPSLADFLHLGAEFCRYHRVVESGPRSSIRTD